MGRIVGIIAQHSTVFYIMALAFGLCVCWGMGANNVANAMGTSVGSGALTVRRALILAAVMEFAGAYLAGGEVAATISKGIIDGRLFEPVPHLLLYGMIGALLAAGIWLTVASMRGWCRRPIPSSARCAAPVSPRSASTRSTG